MPNVEPRPANVAEPRVTEPTTLLTDYLIAVLAVGFAVATARVTGSPPSRAKQAWVAAFAATAVAALAGGTVHGFVRQLGGVRKRRLWKATQVTIGIVSLCLLVAAVYTVASPPLRGWLLVAAAAKFLAYVVVVGRRDDYLPVVIDYGLSMLALAAAQSYAYLVWRAASAPWVVAGVIVSIAAAVVQRSGVALHRHFNHNDLYHVIQMVALYLLYRGGLLFVDR